MREDGFGEARGEQRPSVGDGDEQDGGCRVDGAGDVGGVDCCDGVREAGGAVTLRCKGCDGDC